jgi:hypothetical protein
MATLVFPPGVKNRGVNLTTHLHLVWGFRMSGAVIIPLPLYLHRDTFTFTVFVVYLHMSSKVDLCCWLHCFLKHSAVPFCVPSAEGSELLIVIHIRLTRKVVVCPVTFFVRRFLVQRCFVISFACGYYT